MNIFADDFFKIYDPSVGENEPWYINDHTIVNKDGQWHLFGITRQEPANAIEEKFCAHAVSSDILHLPFCKQPYPFGVEKEHGELHFWAPHIIKHDETYYMYYCAGSLEGHDRYRIHLATSKDLVYWKRHCQNPMIVDGFDARDPMVLRIGDEWVMYYTATTASEGGNHCVACAASKDLINWKKKGNVFTSTIKGTYGGPCESPFFVFSSRIWCRRQGIL